MRNPSFSIVYVTTQLHRFGSMKMLPRSTSKEEITSLMNAEDHYRTLLSIEVGPDTWQEITLADTSYTSKPY